MPSLDTNVLVRLIVEDDAAQSAAALAAISAAVRRGQALHVPVTVVLELEWVLRSRYRFDAAQIGQTLADLLSSADVGLAEERAVEAALERYRSGKAADFADCLHAALAAESGYSPLLTFDVDAARLAGVKLIA
jgi:predicted nucleic-acid-binding protein